MKQRKNPSSPRELFNKQGDLRSAHYRNTVDGELTRQRITKQAICNLSKLLNVAKG